MRSWTAVHTPPPPSTVFPRHRFFHIAFTFLGALATAAGVLFCLVDLFWIGERIVYGAGFAALGAGSAAVHLKMLIRNPPALVVDHTGLTISPHGFIAWREVAGVRIGHRHFQEVLEIWLRPDPTASDHPCGDADTSPHDRHTRCPPSRSPTWRCIPAPRPMPSTNSSDTTHSYPSVHEPETVCAVIARSCRLGPLDPLGVAR